MGSKKYGICLTYISSTEIRLISTEGSQGEPKVAIEVYLDLMTKK